MAELYKYKSRVRDIIYFIQTNEGIHLSEKSLHDIYTNVLQAVKEELEQQLYLADYYKKEYDWLRAKRFPLKWNELRITLAQHLKKDITAEQVLQWMYMIDEGERTR